MNILLREAKKTDMKAVLFLIKELAEFEKESKAVEVSEDDLIRDGFGERPAFKAFGKALYTKVLKYASDQKAKRVSWEVLDWNKVAIDFYKGTGANIMDGWQVVHMEESALTDFVNQK